MIRAMLVLLLAAPAIAQEPPLPPGAVARVGSARLRHPGEICSLVYSADGKLLATADIDGAVQIRDAATGRVRHEFSVVKEGGGRYDGALIARFSADGARLYIATRGAVWAFRVGSEKPTELFALEGQCVALSPDLATAAVTNVLTIRDHDPATGRVGRERPLLGGATRGEFTPHGLLTSGRFIARLTDPGTGKPRGTWRWPAAGTLTAATLSPDGATLAVIASSDEEGRHLDDLFLWNVRGGKPRAVEGAAGVECAAFAPDGKSLAASCRGGLLLIDAATGKVTRLLAAAPRAEQLAFTPDGKVLTVASGPAISHWDHVTGRRLPSSAEPAGGVGRLRFLDARRLLVFAGETVEYDWRTNAVLRRYPLPPNAADLSPDLSLAAVQDGITARVLDAATGREKWRAHTLDFTECNFTLDGTHLILTDRRLCKRLNLNTGESSTILKVENSTFVGSSPDGRHVVGELLLGDAGRPLRVWNGESGKPVRDLTSPHGVGSCAYTVFARDGRRIAVATVNHERKDPVPSGVVIWDVVSGRLIRDLSDLQLEIRSLAFSTDGHSLASPCYNGTIHVFECATGTERVVLTGHKADVAAVAFSLCGRYLATASIDAPIFVWDLFAAPAGTALEPAKLWASLNDDKTAFDTMRQLVATPEKAVALLRERVRPIAPVPEERLRKLIGELDDARFAVRNRAATELRRLADQAEALLTKHAAAAATSAETRGQVRRLLEHVDDIDAEYVVRLRTLEVLERLNTPAARKLIEEYVAGAPAARFTREARAALERMKRP